MRHLLLIGLLGVAAARAQEDDAIEPHRPEKFVRTASIAAMALSGMQKSVAILAEGRTLFNRGEYPQAADAFQEVLEDKELPAAAVAEARLHLGHIAYLEGNWSGARAWFATVMDLAETPPMYRAEAQFFIGLIYMQEGDAQAAPEFVKVLEMQDVPPEFLGRALHYLGRMAFEEYDDPAAEQYLQGALAIRGLKPEDGAATRLYLGRLAQRQERWAAARNYYTLMLDINLNTPEATAAAQASARLGRADAWLAEGRRREAEADWRALAELPLAPMHLRLAAQRRLDQARETTRPAVRDGGLACDFSVWAEAFGRQAERVCAAECPAFVLFAERCAARPGERWLDFFLDLRPAGKPPADLTVKAWLFDARTGRQMAEVKSAAPSAWGWLRLDLRRYALEQARLRVEVHAGRKLLGALETTAQAAVAPPPASRSIPVVMDVPPGVAPPRDWPVMLGVPFAAGALWDLDGLRLVNNAGAEIPCQKEITGRWAEDGAIQWVRFDALATPAEGCSVELEPSRAAPPRGVRVTEKKGAVTVDTGAARYVLGPGKSPVREVFLGGRRLAFCGPQSRGLYVLAQDGRLGQAAADNAMEIETRGPVAACVRFEGYYRAGGNEGAPLARHITRLEFFAGQAWVKVTHTLVLSADTRTTWFKEVGWELDAAVGGLADNGAAPRASFGVERANPDKLVTLPLDTPAASAYMLQADHYRFYGGTNRCLVMHDGVGAEPAAVYAGAEMGDWAMLDGAAGGVMLACRESARQHPKEFELRPDRIVLRLFSNRAGEELDFRAAALARKWNLEAWYPQARRDSYRKLYARDPLAAIAEIDSQAGGWAKTHELLLAPLPPAQLPATLPDVAARLAHLHSFPVYAQADPGWIYQSRAMGAVYPRSPDKFPEAENMIEALWRSRLPGGHAAGGRYGFADYYHGPGYHLAIAPHRYGLSYTLRHDIWLACARAWNRDLREFAEGTTRAYLDNYLCHWNAPRKIAGLYTAGHSAPFDTGTSDLPFYWGDRTTLNTSSSTDLRQFQWLHQLAGDRRGADAVRAFGEGLKTCWRMAGSTEEVVNDRRNIATGRVLMGLKVLVQAYAGGWDPELRFLANDVGRLIYDRQAATGLTKRRPRPEFIGSYYKVNEDAGALLDAWEIIGAPRYQALTRRLGAYLWDNGIGVFPVNRKQGPLGRLGVFFYDENREPWIAAALNFQMRWACTHYDAATGTVRPVGASAVTFVLEGMPMIMDVLERQAAASSQPSAWLAFDDYGQPFQIALRKPHGRAVDVWFKSEAQAGFTGGNLKIAPLAEGRLGCDQITVTEPNRGLARLHLPLEAPGVDYVITAAKPGFHLAFADQPLPLVIHAPLYWRLPDLRPALPVYFRVPAETASARRARILVEGGARFFDPQGMPWRDGAVLRGWTDLPGDRPGLWRFEPEQNRLVRAVNLPPFFALGRPEFYFEPNLPWEYQALPDTPVGLDAAEDGSESGQNMPATASPAGNRSLALPEGRVFKFQAGPAHPSGDGHAFLPHRQGTIEFFFKPAWETFDLKADEQSVVKTMATLPTDKTAWNLVYRVDPVGTAINLGPREPSHALLGSFWTDGRQRVELRCWRTRTLFDRNQWVHVAWSWGPDLAHVGTRRFERVMKMQIFVNGRGHTQSAVYVNDGNLPEGVPRELCLGPGLNGAIDELRVSDIRRYPEDFTPPTREQPLALDEHTRALFRFDGSLQGESFGGEGRPAGELGESLTGG